MVLSFFFNKSPVLQSNYIDSVPLPVLCQICSYLEPKEASKAMATSKKFLNAILNIPNLKAAIKSNCLRRMEVIKNNIESFGRSTAGFKLINNTSLNSSVLFISLDTISKVVKKYQPLLRNVDHICLIDTLWTSKNSLIIDKIWKIFELQKEVVGTKNALSHALDKVKDGIIPNNALFGISINKGHLVKCLNEIDQIASSLGSNDFVEINHNHSLNELLNFYKNHSEHQPLPTLSFINFSQSAQKFYEKYLALKFVINSSMYGYENAILSALSAFNEGIREKGLALIANLPPKLQEKLMYLFKQFYLLNNFHNTIPMTYPNLDLQKMSDFDLKIGLELLLQSEHLKNSLKRLTNLDADEILRKDAALAFLDGRVSEGLELILTLPKDDQTLIEDRLRHAMMITPAAVPYMITQLTSYDKRHQWNQNGDKYLFSYMKNDLNLPLLDMTHALACAGDLIASSKS